MVLTMVNNYCQPSIYEINDYICGCCRKGHRYGREMIYIFIGSGREKPEANILIVELRGVEPLTFSLRTI